MNILQVKVLVTGGSGFIGTNLVESLIKDGYDVANIDINPPQNMNQKNFWHKVDINEYSALVSFVLPFQPNYIIHLAARTDLNGTCVNDYFTNTVGVANILQIAKELKDLKKIIITSSMLVCKTGYEPKNQFDFCPTTFYGESKVVTEKNVWFNQPNCDWVIIRPTSIWGPWFRAPYKNFFDTIINKRYFHLGNKSCMKTYGFIDNSIFQIKTLLLTSTNNNSEKVYYIGDYQPVNIEIWANEIASCLKQFPIIKLPFFVMRVLAYIGDVLKLIHIHFPMTSFRLKNMTTNNIINLTATEKIAPLLPVSRVDGIKKTLLWLNRNK